MTGKFLYEPPPGSDHAPYGCPLPHEVVPAGTVWMCDCGAVHTAHSAFNWWKITGNPHKCKQHCENPQGAHPKGWAWTCPTCGTTYTAATEPCNSWQSRTEDNELDRRMARLKAQEIA